FSSLVFLVSLLLGALCGESVFVVDLLPRLAYSAGRHGVQLRHLPVRLSAVRPGGLLPYATAAAERRPPGRQPALLRLGRAAVSVGAAGVDPRELRRRPLARPHPVPPAVRRRRPRQRRPARR